MIALRGDRCETVPLTEVAGKKKVVPPDHPWITTAQRVGTCVGV
jgi:6-phosphofructokinase 1